MLKSAKTWIMLAQVPLAWEWLVAGWDKITSGGFGATFAESLPTTLDRFAQQKTATGQVVSNPNTWYVNSFLDWAKSNPTLFGYLVCWGELITGVLLFLAVGYYLFTQKSLPKILLWLVIASLVGGIFMNLNYYFASGWPASAISTRSLNLLMILSQLVFLGYYLFAEKTGEVK